MHVLLFVAALVAWFGLGERIDAGAILAIVFANILIALLQEGKTENALRALRKMETPSARVRRDGVVRDIPAREVVPGDLVLLAAGDRVPADVTITESTGLEIDESMLTGESLPVAKRLATPATGPRSHPGSDAFAGTLVTRGTGSGEVTATGQRTKLGAIAAQLRTLEPPTPLQRELRAVGTRLGAVAIAIAIAVFAVMLLRFGVNRAGLETAFLTSAALAVAAVPSGLPTVVTVGLALGVRRMAARGSIVRRLPAVETLGSTTVILTDKTGTLTQNQMQLDVVCLADGSRFALSDLRPHLREAAIETITLCNDATLEPPTGDPLEIALLDAVGAIVIGEIRSSHPRLSSRPFDSTDRSMWTINATNAGPILSMKGAPEVVLDRCVRVLDPEQLGEQPLEPPGRISILAHAEELARGGARVLALARGALPAGPTSIEEERDLTFIALVALRDPARPEAAQAVADATSAGIRVVMVTGDHPGTAAAIAEEVGLVQKGATVITGEDIRNGGFPGDPTSVRVYARVCPEEKLALVRELQRRGDTVAVTGDGVNDAPALRHSDIGVAMGRSGSDVAREAADMVVTDDNLATIVHAVRQGRGIYDNVRKVVEYLVGGNLSEILVVVGGLALFPHLGVPLLPLQLLWMNLLPDGLPALALAVDTPDPDLMKRPPRRTSDHLLSGPRLRTLLVRALLISSAALGSLAVAHFVWHQPWTHARSSMFCSLMVAHLFYAFAVRRPDAHGGRPNRWLWAAVAGGIALQCAVVSVPVLQRIFSTVWLSPKEWLLVAAAGTAPVGFIY
ncbi:MAG TPA: cation-transporting P-type ATPase, partial [Actinomycetota bacterium]|nr:cation-transporting P-type ATPase [Actinomycetota bacterium]